MHKWEKFLPWWASEIQIEQVGSTSNHLAHNQIAMILLTHTGMQKSEEEEKKISKIAHGVKYRGKHFGKKKKGLKLADIKTAR